MITFIGTIDVSSGVSLAIALEEIIWLTNSGVLTTQTANNVVDIEVDAVSNQGQTVTYSLVSGTIPPDLTLNTSTGLISGTLAQVAQQTTFDFTIQAQGRIASALQSFEIVVNHLEEPPIWNTPADTLLASGQRGAAFVANAVSATDPQSNAISYTIIFDSNTTATWLFANSINSNTGVISGTWPIVNTTTTYDVNIEANNGLLFVDRVFMLQAVFVDQAPVWNNGGSLGTFFDGSSFNQSVSASSPDGFTITYSLTSGALPGALTLNGSSGAITGTLSNVSTDTTFNFTITASDGIKTTAQAFSITVERRAPVWNNSGSLGTSNGGTSVTYFPSATDPDGGSLTFAVASGFLPTGLSINTGSGEISGTTPSPVGTTVYDFTLSASNGVRSATQSFSITVNGQPPFSVSQSKTSLPLLPNASNTLQFTITNINALSAQMDVNYAQVTVPANVTFTWSGSNSSSFGGNPQTDYIFPSGSTADEQVTLTLDLTEASGGPTSGTGTVQVIFTTSSPTSYSETHTATINFE